MASGGEHVGPNLCIFRLFDVESRFVAEAVAATIDRVWGQATVCPDHDADPRPLPMGRHSSSCAIGELPRAMESAIQMQTDRDLNDILCWP